MLPSSSAPRWAKSTAAARLTLGLHDRERPHRRQQRAVPQPAAGQHVGRGRGEQPAQPGQPQPRLPVARAEGAQHQRHALPQVVVGAAVPRTASSRSRRRRSSLAYRCRCVGVGAGTSSARGPRRPTRTAAGRPGAATPRARRSSRTSPSPAVAQLAVRRVLQEPGAERLERLLTPSRSRSSARTPWVTAVVRHRSSQQSAGGRPSGTSTRDWWQSRNSSANSANSSPSNIASRSNSTYACRSASWSRAAAAGPGRSTTPPTGSRRCG